MIISTRITQSVALITCSMAALTAHAHVFNNNLSWPYHGRFVIQAGVFDAHQGENQHIGINGLIGDQFTVTRHNDSNALLGVGYYIDGQPIRNYKMMYGLNAFYLPETTVRGHVLQENIFDNLSYQYRINQFPIYVDAKVLFNPGINWASNLTVDAGLGLNVIRSFDFKEKSLDGGITIPDHPFSDNTTVDFSATIGAGVIFNSMPMTCLPIEIGYRFFYLGEGKFKTATNQINHGLRTGNSYANALIVSVFL